jgi:hypothetical protein
MRRILLPSERGEAKKSAERIPNRESIEIAARTHPPVFLAKSARQKQNAPDIVKSGLRRVRKLLKIKEDEVRPFDKRSKECAMRSF